MTLPASFPLSMSQIATELGLSLPLSINHPWVLLLAGKTALPVSFSDLLGKTGHFSGALPSSEEDSIASIGFSNAPFFGGTLFSLVQEQDVGALSLSFSTAPNWTGKIKVANTTVGLSQLLTKSNSTTWSGTGQIIRTPTIYVDNYTIFPSN